SINPLTSACTADTSTPSRPSRCSANCSKSTWYASQLAGRSPFSTRRYATNSRTVCALPVTCSTTCIGLDYPAPRASLHPLLFACTHLATHQVRYLPIFDRAKQCWLRWSPEPASQSISTFTSAEYSPTGQYSGTEPSIPDTPAATRSPRPTSSSLRRSTSDPPQPDCPSTAPSASRQ